MDAPEVDLTQLACSSSGFTPADIEHAAQVASQAALERALAQPESVSGPTTGDYEQALEQTRATVSHRVAADFAEDISGYTRL